MSEKPTEKPTEIILETIQLPMPMDEFCKHLKRMVKEHGANAYVRGNGKTMDVITRGRLVDRPTDVSDQ